MRDEFELIGLLRERLAAAGPVDGGRVVLGSGDDAAVTVPGGATATSVDAVVEGVHFRRETFPARSIGAKALAAALSDLAAMGAAPGEAYVQLGLPAGLAESDLVELADGLAALALAEGVTVAGGDVVASPTLFVAVSVVGHGERETDFIRRSGARAGDLALVSGPLGGAAAGLLLLEGAVPSDAVTAAEAMALRGRQLEPAPRLAAGRALAAAGVSAMIDLSDGLAGDAAHLARASGVRLEIDAAAVPAQPGVEAVASAAGLAPEELVLAGGEDYELLATVSPERLDAALAAVRGCGLASPAAVGRITAGEGLALVGPTGSVLALRGYDQLRSRALDERI